MNTLLPCQDQYFAGGQSYNCPYSTTTSGSSVDVSKETWVSFWATGLLDNREPQQAPQAPESSRHGWNFPVLDSCSWEETQLSSQLYRNKQLQDTLVQKEEELARLHEENSQLRQHLNKTLVKCLEEKAKKLLSLDEISKVCGKFRKGKRKPKEQRHTTAETPHSKTVKRNLFREFVNYEEQPGPCVDPWVLQTLGLKDLDTIDDSLSANYSALSSHARGISSVSSQFLQDAVGYTSVATKDLKLRCETDTTFLQSAANNQEEIHYFPPQPSQPPLEMPYHGANVSPNKTEVAFSTSLSPHCNVKTHSFHQGQAFVCRDEEGGWKFTWVPKQT